MAGRVENLVHFQKGRAKTGGKPKGYKHLSTHIQNLLNDKDFTLPNFMNGGTQDWKGAPIDAIITVAVMQALQGDHHWAEWLAKHGYNENINVNVTQEVIHYLNSTPRPDNTDTGLPTQPEAKQLPPKPSL